MRIEQRQIRETEIQAVGYRSAAHAKKCFVSFSKQMCLSSLYITNKKSLVLVPCTVNHFKGMSLHSNGLLNISDVHSTHPDQLTQEDH